MNVAALEDKINRHGTSIVRHRHRHLTTLRLFANRKFSLLALRRNSTKESAVVSIKDNIFAGAVEEKRVKN